MLEIFHNTSVSPFSSQDSSLCLEEHEVTMESCLFCLEEYNAENWCLSLLSPLGVSLLTPSGYPAEAEWQVPSLCIVTQKPIPSNQLPAFWERVALSFPRLVTGNTYFWNLLQPSYFWKLYSQIHPLHGRRINSWINKHSSFQCLFYLFSRINSLFC